MDISINQEFTGVIDEDYSEYDNDDVISIFGEICKIIDDLKIASFSVLFKKWDERFKHTDFAYDFTSIGTDLTGLIHFLEKPVGEYSLGFMNQIGK